MSAHDVLANATPRPWSWNADAWSIVGPRNEQALVGGPDETLTFIAPNIRLAINAVNEYEALIGLESSVRSRVVDHPRNCDCALCFRLNALDALRADLSRESQEPDPTRLEAAGTGSDNKGA